MVRTFRTTGPFAMSIAPMKSLSVSIAAGLLVLSTARPAAAFNTFPGYLEKHLNVKTLPAEPTSGPLLYCELCHNNPAGGIGTATQPFGLAMLSYGVTGTSDEATVDAALDRAAGEGLDSNHDGIPDIQEIKEGKSPDTESGSIAAPAYGCGAPTSAIAATTPERAPGLLAGSVVAGALVALRRRARGRARRVYRA